MDTICLLPLCNQVTWNLKLSSSYLVSLLVVLIRDLPASQVLELKVHYHTEWDYYLVKRSLWVGCGGAILQSQHSRGLHTERPCFFKGKKKNYRWTGCVSRWRCLPPNVTWVLPLGYNAVEGESCSKLSSAFTHVPGAQYMHIKVSDLKISIWD